MKASPAKTRSTWFLAGAMLLVLAHAAHAGTRTWSGTTDNAWSTGAANWSGVAVPITDDSLIFTSITGAGGLNLNNNLTSGSFNVAGITFNPGAAAFVIGNGTTGANVGNTFVLTGNLVNNSLSLATINCPFSMTVTRTFTVSGGGLNLGGNISGTGGGMTISGPGILTLSGNNTYTGTTTGKGGSIVLDYSGGSNTADPISSGSVTLDMGTLELKGKTSGSTADTISSFTMSSAVGEANTLRLTANGGSGVTPTVTTFNMASAASISQTLNLIDLSSSAANSLTLTALGATAKAFNGILMTSPDSGTSGRANLVVRDSTGYGFATLSGTTTGTIGILSSGTPLDATASSATVNYFLTAAGTLTRTADLNFSTLTIDSTAGAVTLDLGTTYKFIQNGNGRGLLVKGASDVNITGSAAGAMFPSTLSLWVHNYATGTVNLGLKMINNGTVMFGGTGLTVLSGMVSSSSALNLYIEGGILRPTAASDLSTATINVNSGGILEIGADLNGATAGDLTQSVGGGSGQVRIWGSSGFSASGADRIVAFGGVAAPSALTWGATYFLTASSGSGDGNFIFKLSSDKSDAMVTVQNAIALGSIQRTIEVANGTAATDATLSGILSSATGGGVNKTGAGTLALSGNNTYSGPTIVNTGTLLVNNTSGSGTGSGAVTVNNSGTLGGSGAISGVVTVNPGGTLASGNHAIGTLNLGAAPSLGGTLAMKINQTDLTSDKLNLTSGSFTYAGTLALTVTAGTLSGGEEFDLFDFSSASSGSFAITTTPALAAGLNWWQGNLAANGKLILNRAPHAPAISMGAHSGEQQVLRIIGGKYAPTDADGDLLSVAAIQNPSTQGGTVTTDGTSVTYTAAAAFTGADDFTYTVSDGRGGLATNTVTVQVAINGAGFNLISAPVNNGDGTATIIYAGIPGYHYALETTANLTTPPIYWTPIVTNIVSPNGQLSFTFSTGAGQGFFRTRHVP